MPLSKDVPNLSPPENVYAQEFLGPGFSVMPSNHSGTFDRASVSPLPGSLLLPFPEACASLQSVAGSCEAWFCVKSCMLDADELLPRTG